LVVVFSWRPTALFQALGPEKRAGEN